MMDELTISVIEDDVERLIKVLMEHSKIGLDFDGEEDITFLEALRNITQGQSVFHGMRRNSIGVRYRCPGHQRTEYTTISVSNNCLRLLNRLHHGDCEWALRLIVGMEWLAVDMPDDLVLLGVTLPIGWLGFTGYTSRKDQRKFVSSLLWILCLCEGLPKSRRCNMVSCHKIWTRAGNLHEIRSLGRFRTLLYLTKCFDENDGFVKPSKEEMQEEIKKFEQIRDRSLFDTTTQHGNGNERLDLIQL